MPHPLGIGFRRRVHPQRNPPPISAPEKDDTLLRMVRKRELIDTSTDKSFVRRNKPGTSFIESDDVGRSLAADRRRHAKTKVKSGEGDKGDRPRPKAKRKAASKGRKKAASRKGATRKPARKKGAKRRWYASRLHPLRDLSSGRSSAIGPLHEIKLDGWRNQIRVEDGTVAIRTRNGPRLHQHVPGDRPSERKVAAGPAATPCER